MKHLTIAVLAMTTLILGGCSKKKDDLVGKAKGFADQMCACKGEAKCIEKAGNAYKTWMQAAEKGARPSKAEEEKLEAEESRLEGCAETGEADKGGGEADKGGGEADNGGGEALARLKEFRDQMCACGTDAACGTKVDIAEDTWEDTIDDSAFPAALQQEAETVKNEFRACRTTSGAEKQ